MQKPSLVASCSRAVLPSMALSLALLAVQSVGTPRAVFAQDRPTAEGFVLSAPLRDSMLGVWGTSALEPGTLALGLSGSYARHPLAVEDPDQNKVGQLVRAFSTLELMATVGVLRRVDLSIAIPGHLLSKGSGVNSQADLDLQDAVVHKDSVALGDIRLTPRLTLLEPASESGYGLALLVPVSLPTGDKKLYAGEKLRVEPKLAFEGVTHDFSLAINAGYMFRERTELFGTKVDDMVTWGLGVGVRIADPLQLLVEVSGRLNVMSDNFDSKDAPTELLGAFRLITSRFLAQLGAGPGLVGGITEPSWRILGAISWLPPPPPPPDADKDGVPDARDRCVNEPEDRDGFQDADGCPDPDNDGDRILDLADRCPNDAEDADGFQDADGCPDPDNDQDGIEDARDACPNQPGSPNANSAINGCPDRDEDGIADAQDACPDKAGVASTDPSRNGCPADRDGDGILDPDDACPDAEGPATGDPATNGCPKARVESGQIKILERVEFVTGSANLVASSGTILDEVQKVLLQHPEITHLIVEGHTDSTGSEQTNETLSRRRAESVRRWFVSHGVEASRLEARGYGESRPIDTNDTPEGRSKNRRVEFHIQGASEAPPAP